MNKSLFLVLLVLVALVAIDVDAKKSKKKKKAPVTVDEGDSFSDQEHYNEGGDHDPKYDQEAFLGGEDEAKSVANLTPKQIKEKLRTIFTKIDLDQDKKISRKELLEWIVDNMNKHVKKNTKVRFDEVDKDKDGKVTWKEYADVEFKDQDSHGGDKESMEQMKKTDERRFKAADTNGDGALDIDELATFVHPEESPRMTSLLVEENIEALDKDGDGLINFKEYSGVEGTPTTDKETMDALKDTFNKDLDKNKDGQLNKEEVRDWIMPGGNDDPAVGETEHLMKEADTDKDNYLTIEEILQNHETFAGGRVTAYGELLKNEL